MQRVETTNTERRGKKDNNGEKIEEIRGKREARR